MTPNPTPIRAPRRTLKVNLALFLLAASVLMGAGVVIAITWGGVAPIPEISVEGELARATTTLSTYPHHNSQFAGTTPWPENQTEFKNYLTWLENHAPDQLENFSTEVTYHRSANIPCLEIQSPAGPWHQTVTATTAEPGACKTND